MQIKIVSFLELCEDVESKGVMTVFMDTRNLYQHQKGGILVGLSVIVY